MSANFLNPKNWSNVTDEGRNNLVFQNRNHAYGAFVIRRDYNNNLFFALFLSIGIFVSAFVIPKFLIHDSLNQEVIIPTVDAVIIPMDITPKIQKPEELPVSVAEPPKKVVSQQNNLTYMAKDEKVSTSMTSNDQIINPGNTTITGDAGTPVVITPSTNIGLPIEKPNDVPMISPEIMPLFPGGEAALFRFLQSNINYPSMARENGIKGTVIVGFVIDINGKPVNLTILKGIKGGKDLEAEAMRVIAAMPNWSVGMNNNKPVSVMFSLPVKFDLRN